MTPIAVSTTGLTLYYSSIVIALGIAACFLLAYSFYVSDGGHPAAMLLYAPLAIILSIFLSRFLHWYCHTEQYESLARAVTDYKTGDFVLSGALVGTALAALLTGLFGRLRNVPKLLDATAPGAVLAIACIRLSSLFNTSCLSKITITNPSLQKLPLGYPLTDAAGNTSYRFATFFVEFLILLALFIGILIFYCRRKDIPAKEGRGNRGSVAIEFLVWYSALEMICDSTRFDSSFARSNGFVSMVQMVCAVSLLLALVFFSIRAVSADGLKARHFLVWIGFLLAIGVTGFSEYMVQRHGDWYLPCYAAMAVGCFFMAFTVSRMYRMQCESHF